MSTETHTTSLAVDTRRTGLKAGIAILAVILVAGGLYLVSNRQEIPGLYHPARNAITDAALILAETYGSEETLQHQFQTVHHLLENAISLLDKAEKLDPADKREIDTLRVRLQALDNPQRMASGDPQSLQRSYHELTKQLNSLAKKLGEAQI